MKIGTITFHAPNNNGSFLQAYALQTVLRKQLNVDNEIIDFYSKKADVNISKFGHISVREVAGKDFLNENKQIKRLSLLVFLP